MKKVQNLLIPNASHPLAVQPVRASFFKKKGTTFSVNWRFYLFLTENLLFDDSLPLKGRRSKASDPQSGWESFSGMG